MKFLTNFLFLLILILIFAGVFLFGKLGLLGNFSKAFGVNQPISLGIEYGPLDLALGLKKGGVSVEELSLTDAQLISIKYSGSHYVEESFINEEVTALLNNGQWRYYPVSNMQVRINEGSFEASGFLIPGRLKGYIDNTGNPEGIIYDFLKFLSIGKNNIPFYLSASIQFLDNKLNVDVKKIVIGALDIPRFLIKDNQKNINNFVEEKVNFVEGLSIQSLSLSQGELKFSGTLPSVEMIEPAKNF